jgi:hypothetical protein
MSAVGPQEPDNITGCQLSKIKVGNGGTAISVGQRFQVLFGVASRVAQFHGFSDDWAQETDLPCGLIKVHEWRHDQGRRLDQALQPGKKVHQKRVDLPCTLALNPVPRARQDVAAAQTWQGLAEVVNLSLRSGEFQYVIA